MARFSLLTLFFFISSITLILAQEQIPEKKVIYHKGDSIIFNKSLPVYIHISSGEDGHTYKKPFYLDTEGVNYIRTKWETDSTGKYLLPQREQVWPVYADSKPPKTTVEFIASNKYVFKGKVYYSDDLKARLIAKDELAGVKKIYYSINGSDFKEYVSLIPFQSKMDIKFKFYAVDNVGNVEPVEEISYFYDKNNLSFGIDDTAPETTINKTESILGPKQNIKLSSVDDGVGVGVIYYKIDSGGYKPYETPISLSQLSDGEHTVEYYALDYINNIEESKTYAFYLDKKAPQIKIDEEINNFNDTRTITLSAIDNRSGVEKILYQLNDHEQYVEYTTPFEINVAHEKIKIIAIDNVGNINVRVISYSKK